MALSPAAGSPSVDLTVRKPGTSTTGHVKNLTKLRESPVNKPKPQLVSERLPQLPAVPNLDMEVVS